MNIISQRYMEDFEMESMNQMYLECVSALDDVDYYTEAAEKKNIIARAFDKLIGFIQKIIDAIKNFFKKESKIKQDPAEKIPCDKKELSRIQKFIAAVKKIFMMPVEKVGKMLHDKKAIGGLSIAALTGFSVATIIKVKHNSDVKKRNEANADIVVGNIRRDQLVKYMEDIETELNEAKKFSARAKALAEKQESGILKNGRKARRKETLDRNAREAEQNVRSLTDKLSWADYERRQAEKGINDANKRLAGMGAKSRVKATQRGDRTDYDFEVEKKMTYLQEAQKFAAKIVSIISSIVGKLKQAISSGKGGNKESSSTSSSTALALPDKKAHEAEEQKKAAREYKEFGRAIDESALDGYDEDDDIMIESSADHEDYLDPEDDIFREASENEFVDDIADLLDTMF